MSDLVRIFLSYAHEDESYKNRLDIHFTPLKQSMNISTWNDREVLAGSDWDKEISENLLSADVIIMLISADFLASEYTYEKELSKAIERHKKRRSPCNWDCCERMYVG